jgi:hypothetical protein
MSTEILRQKIAAMEPGTIFTTQSLLGESPATRNAIDVMLHRAKNRKELEHLAQGVYRKPTDEPPPPIEVVAEIKVNSFKRRMCGCSGRCCLYAIAIMKNGKKKQRQVVFAIDGSSSAFMYGKTRVVLRNTSAKKILWCQSEFGLMIRRLTYVGREDCSDELIATSLRKLKRVVSSAEIKRFAKLMPNWLWAKLNEYFACAAAAA